MKHKIFATAVAFVGLFCTAPQLAKPVEARSVYSNYYLKTRKYVTTKRIKASYMTNNFLTTRHPVLKTKYLKKGTHLTLMRGGSDPDFWCIKNHSVKGLGKIYRKNGYWTILVHRNDWLVTEYTWNKKYGETFGDHTYYNHGIQLTQVETKRTTYWPQSTGPVMAHYTTLFHFHLTNNSNDIIYIPDYARNHISFTTESTNVNKFATTKPDHHFNDEWSTLFSNYDSTVGPHKSKDFGIAVIITKADDVLAEVITNKGKFLTIY